MSKRTKYLLGIGVIAALVVGWQVAAFAGAIGTAQGFEDDDGNLVVNSTFDWNGFKPATWSPHPSTTPNRQADKVVSGFTFKGIEDWQATTADSAFAGGVKQDDNCATVTSAKAPNKDDLKRIYLASKTGSDGHTYLDLAWVRIPQQTTSSSAHVGFEFNQGTTPCVANQTNGLVRRTAGDMLVVYDFEGGAADPVITLRRWVTSGACEISNDTAPCWGPAANLSASGVAEAKVNVGTTAVDELAPPALNSNTGTSVSETLNDSEFGEAGIDLTAANVIPANSCASFGKAFAVSRSSGNSGQAQMKDLVGPANFNLTNCGTVKIIKHTAPRGLNQNFGYTSTLAGSQISCTSDTTPASFTLNDNGNTTADSAANTETCSNVPTGSYTVTENADPAGFTFTDLSCTATGTGTSATPASGNATRTASITMAGGGNVICTYTNTQQLGAIEITKTDSKSGNNLAGAKFSITPSGGGTSQTVTTDSGGRACVDTLAFGNYDVKETSAPTGYAIDDTSTHTVTVDNNAKCSDIPFGGEPLSFSDTPLSNIQVNFKDGGSGVTDATISCDNTTGTSNTSPASGWDKSLTVNGVHAGTSTDPTVVQCTLTIDP